MRRWVCVLAGGLVSVVSAGEVTFEVDQRASQADFDVCLSGACDSGTSALSGFIRMDFDDATNPSSASLLEAELALVDDQNLFIEIILGSVAINTTDIAFMYPLPGTPFGPVPVTNGAFSFADVPLLGAGVLSYTATGSACAILQAQMLPCVGAFDLGIAGVQMADALAGQIEIVDGQAMLTGSTMVTAFFDPMNPGFANATFSADIVARGDLPIPGDWDGDGDVDLFDFETFDACYTGPDSGPPLPQCTPFDLDGDDDVDKADLGTVLLFFTGGR